MQGEKADLIRQVREIMEGIYHLVGSYLPREWLSLDLSTSQLRVLLLLFTQGHTSMGALASSSNLPLSTATGTVDHLIERELVVRGAVPRDRRLVVCWLSPKGQELASRLWELGRLRVEQFLESLSMEQLKVVIQAMEFIHQAAEKRSQQDHQQDG